MKKFYTHKFDSTIGPIYLGSTEKGLAVISFGQDGKKYFNHLVKKHYGNYRTVPGESENKEAKKQLSQYLAGRLKKFTLKLDIDDGTSFQKKALRKIGSIPYGKTTTYGTIAEAIGHKGAARAVGTVNAKNRLPIVIPCHRVLATNGLGGYAGGLKLKRFFLDLEKAKY